LIVCKHTVAETASFLSSIDPRFSAITPGFYLWICSKPNAEAALTELKASGLIDEWGEDKPNVLGLASKE
jgi:hypothetical protein